MKIYLGCIPCFARQALEASCMATRDQGLREKIIREALKKASELPFDKTPPHMGMEIHRIIRGLLGNIDPYLELKRTYNKKAMELYPSMKEIVESAGRQNRAPGEMKAAASDSPTGLRGTSTDTPRGDRDRMEAATRLAIAGNIIDFGFNVTNNVIELNQTIKETLNRPFAINHFPQFKKALQTAEHILYIADNAGEIAFDRVLIEEIEDFAHRVVLAVKGEPIINDATIEDAREVGLADMVKVIDTGSDAPGVILEVCSREFKDHLSRADLVISKGQGNYETLSEMDHNTFFLLKAKCEAIAGDLRVEKGDIVVKRAEPKEK
ncbi:MAG: damage-control phosphatase ARMT1 family protein [Spirochaetota bacterium]